MAGYQEILCDADWRGARCVHIQLTDSTLTLQDALKKVTCEDCRNKIRHHLTERMQAIEFLRH
jgi:hypothetical protein